MPRGHGVTDPKQRWLFLAEGSLQYLHGRRDGQVQGAFELTVLTLTLLTCTEGGAHKFKCDLSKLSQS